MSDRQLLIRELTRFLVTGSSAVAVDLAVYAYLLSQQPSPSLAKALSFISGMIVAYVLNKFWTFSQPKKSLPEALRFISLYLSTLTANVGVNWLVLQALGKDYVPLAFLAATGTSTVLNFVGQKFWVFRQ